MRGQPDILVRAAKVLLVLLVGLFSLLVGADKWAKVDNANPVGVGTLQQECGIAGCLHWEWGF